MITVSERLRDDMEMLYKLLDQFEIKIRVAMPGIIQSFNAATMTAVVTPAITENINDDGVVTPVQIQNISDVPVVFPGGGGYSITFPINSGDECLLVFGDNCFDMWWQNGDVQNQGDKRRHDLSDAVAIVGIKSLPEVTSNISTNSAQFRNSDASLKVEITATGINIGGASVQTLIDARFAAFYDAHTHASSGAGTPNTPLTPVLSVHSTAYTKAG